MVLLPLDSEGYYCPTTRMSPRGQMLLRWGQTCNLCMGCMGLGLILALTGVALLDLVEIYGSDISSVSHLITTRCVGGLLGSLVGGKLYDAYNVQAMTILMMAIACVAVLMIPLSGSLPLAHAVIFFGGISSGAFDTGANVWIIRMWPENSNPALQVFHLAFGVGCVVAPLIAEPFLSTGVVREGLFFSVTGVALLDLAEVYGTDVRSVAQLVTTRGVGILAGGFIGGRLYDRLHTQLLSIVMTLLMAAGVLLTPSCGRLGYAHSASVLAGLAMGALDTGANVWLINLWPTGCGPALQAYHLAFGIGAFIAPFVTEPFLSVNVSAAANVTATSANITSPWAQISGMVLGEELEVAISEMREPRLSWAFGIVSGFIFLVAILMFIVYLLDRSDYKPSPAPSNQSQNCRVNRFAYTLLALLGCYIMVYLGLECSFGQMLPTFAVESDLQMTKSEAAYLTSLFFLTFTVARIGSIFWSAVASPSCILLTCQVLLVITFALLPIFGASSATWLWALSGVAGVGLAAVFAAAVSYAVQFLVITNTMMSVVTVSASLGTMVPPVLVGMFIEQDAMVLAYVCIAAALLMNVLFLAMHLCARGRPRLMTDTTVEDSACANSGEPQHGLHEKF
ncbi:sodium-dependent glucose transporter 1B-like isoform X3 [Amblyomma americanum]